MTEDKIKTPDWFNPILTKRLNHEIALRVRLGELFGETKVDTWLKSPNPAFGNRPPIDLIREDDTDSLYAMIYRVGSGEPI